MGNKITYKVRIHGIKEERENRGKKANYNSSLEIDYLIKIKNLHGVQTSHWQCLRVRGECLNPGSLACETCALPLSKSSVTNNLLILLECWSSSNLLFYFFFFFFGFGPHPARLRDLLLTLLRSYSWRAWWTILNVRDQTRVGCM